MQRRELIIQKNNDVKDFVLNPVFIQNIGLTTKGVLSSLPIKGIPLPPQLEQTKANLTDKNRLFEVVNIINLKWMSTFATITWLKEDKKSTLNLIAVLNDELKVAE